jgi:predicted transcriptional regulator
MLRGKLDIFADVLEVARKGATKTRIISQANLNQKVATCSLSLLVDLDLLAEKHNSPVSYITTEKGLRLLQEYHHMKRLLDSKIELEATF